MNENKLFIILALQRFVKRREGSQMSVYEEVQHIIPISKSRFYEWMAVPAGNTLYKRYRQAVIDKRVESLIRYFEMVIEINQNNETNKRTK